MSKPKLTVKYSLYAVTFTDPNNPNREFITDFDEEIYDHEIESLVETFGRPGLEYDYIVVEKQYHRK